MRTLMRRLPFALFLATTILLGVTAAPSMAAPGHQAAGDRLDLRDGDQSFPASTPFHIAHGFFFLPGDRAIGLSRMTLDMDGTVLTADFVEWEHLTDSKVSELWVYNFPAGLTGTHVFTRHYLSPCDNDTIPCDGSRIHTLVETFTPSAEVTFS